MWRHATLGVDRELQGWRLCHQTRLLAKIGANGKVCVYSLAATDIVVDLNGFVPAVSDIKSIGPARLLELATLPASPRSTAPTEASASGCGAVYTLQVSGRGGVPDGADPWRS